MSKLATARADFNETEPDMRTPVAPARRLRRMSGRICALIDAVRICIWSSMQPVPARRIIDLQDRARLRERFFGAARTVLARP